MTRQNEMTCLAYNDEADDDGGGCGFGGLVSKSLLYFWYFLLVFCVFALKVKCPHLNKNV